MIHRASPSHTFKVLVLASFLLKANLASALGWLFYDRAYSDYWDGMLGFGTLEIIEYDPIGNTLYERAALNFRAMSNSYEPTDIFTGGPYWATFTTTDFYQSFVVTPYLLQNSDEQTNGLTYQVQILGSEPGMTTIRAYAPVFNGSYVVGSGGFHGEWKLVDSTGLASLEEGSATIITSSVGALSIDSPTNIGKNVVVAGFSQKNRANGNPFSENPIDFDVPGGVIQYWDVSTSYANEDGHVFSFSYSFDTKNVSPNDSENITIYRLDDNGWTDLHANIESEGKLVANSSSFSTFVLGLRPISPVPEMQSHLLFFAGLPVVLMFRRRLGNC